MDIYSQSWAKIWTTKYSFLSVSLFGKEYIKEMKSELGMGFDHILFRYEKGLVTLFRIESETKAVAQYLAEQSLKTPGYAEKSVSELRRIDTEMKKIAAETKDIPSAETLQSFIDLHLKLIPHFLVPIWASNELANISGDEERKKEVLAMYERVRKDTEQLYPSLEAFIERVYKAIGEKSGVEVAALQALSPDELQTYIVEGTLPETTVLNARYEYSVVYADVNSVTISTGKEAEAIIQKITEIKGSVKELKGTKAYGGFAKGKVKLIFRDEDCNSFEDGQILVTTMTRPEWLPIMKRSAAFVTDAGGILCHAAIVAREMKVPCVTNTKIASQVLKDGMEVEVDADKGIVKIL